MFMGNWTLGEVIQEDYYGRREKCPICGALVKGDLHFEGLGDNQAGIDSIPNHYYYKYHCLKCGYKWEEK